MCRRLTKPSLIPAATAHGLLLLLLLAVVVSFKTTDAFVTGSSRTHSFRPVSFAAPSSPQRWTTALSSSVPSAGSLEDDDLEAEQSESLSTGTDGLKVTKLESLIDFLEFLAEDDRLCVIKFHADWCKSCQRFGVKYTRLASKFGGDDGPIRFASIEYGANLNLCRSLGVKKLPTVHIYKGEMGRITQFACGPSKFPMLVDKLARYLTMSEEELMFEKKMEEGGDLADSILRDLQKEAAAATATSSNDNGSTVPSSSASHPVSEEVRSGRALNDLWSKLEAQVKRLAED